MDFCFYDCSWIYPRLLQNKNYGLERCRWIAGYLYLEVTIHFLDIYTLFMDIYTLSMDIYTLFVDIYTFSDGFMQCFVSW